MLYNGATWVGINFISLNHILLKTDQKYNENAEYLVAERVKNYIDEDRN